MSKDPICGMTVDETSGISLTRDGITYYFCSEHCRKTFAGKTTAEPAGSADASCCAPGTIPWYGTRVARVAAVLLLPVLLAPVVPILAPFSHSLRHYVMLLWLPILVGLVAGGIIDHYVPREYIVHLLARPRKTTIFRAVGLGFMMSSCSCGILALAVQLYKKGASTSAVIAFLLASPWANLAITVMLISLFGIKGLFIIMSAIVIAITTGLLFQFLEKLNFVERNPVTADIHPDFTIGSDVRKRWQSYRFSRQALRDDLAGIYRGSVALSQTVLWWMLIGMGLAAAASAYIPSHLFNNYMGPTFTGMLVTLLAATVIEVCSEGSAPLAMELFTRTGAFGNALVFLMAGVVTDYTEIGLLWHTIGRRTAILLPLVTVPQVLFFGWIANQLL